MLFLPKKDMLVFSNNKKLYFMKIHILQQIGMSQQLQQVPPEFEEKVTADKYMNEDIKRLALDFAKEIPDILLSQNGNKGSKKNSSEEEMDKEEILSQYRETYSPPINPKIKFNKNLDEYKGRQ